MSNELKELKEMFRYRRVSMTSHDSQIEMLREEVREPVTGRKRTAASI